MDIVKICNALGNETRYQIIQNLSDKSLETCCGRIEYFENGVSVADVVTSTGLAQSTVSQHLLVLEQAGLISKEKRGHWTCYFLNKEILQQFLVEFQKTFFK